MTNTMFEAIAICNERQVKITGAPQTGKTEALLRRCTALLANNVAPEAILIETTSAQGALYLRDRLAALADAHLAQRVNITTAQDACLRVLDLPVARAFTGRNPRVLAPFEYNFFLEDLKTLGHPVRALRKMLTHFRRELAEGVPVSEVALPGTEKETWDMAQRLLHFEGGMLSEEMASLCIEVLKDPACRAEIQQFEYVLCDDFQNLSHAQQTALCLMASKQVVVAGDIGQTVSLATDFPHPDGFRDFDALRHGVQCFTLETAFGNVSADQFCNAILAHDSASAPAPTAYKGAADDLQYIKWNTPEEELDGLCKYALHTLETSQESQSIPLRESDLCFVVPNKHWARMFETMLTKRGFTTSTLGFDPIAGDPRENGRNQVLRAYTLMNLIAHPQDGVAWRAWCGYGNYLTNSDAWSHLVEYANAANVDLLEALASLPTCVSEDGNKPFLRAGVLAQAWTEGQECIARFANRRGYALLKAIGADTLPAFAPVACTIIGEETADEIFAAFHALIFAPTYASDSHAVHVCSYAATVGCTHRWIIAPGCVNGLMPHRDAFEAVSTEEARTDITNRDRRLFASALATSTNKLTISTFSRASLELAEGTKMQVNRVRSDANGQRIALVSPTCFINEAGAFAPSTDSGQALLAELHLD